MKHNQKGFSLVELMVAAGILGVITLVMINSTSLMQKNANSTKLKRQVKEIVIEMINTLTSTASTVQIDYSSNPTFPSELPIAWDTTGEKMLVSSCGNPCPLKGRMAVLMIPIANKKIYQMKIRITHPEFKTAKIYSYLVGAQ